MISGDTLRILRETKGWDQQTLARRTGIDASVVSRLERGLQTDLKASVLIKLAQSLGVSLDVLVSHQTESHRLIGDLEVLLPQLQELSPGHQRQLAAIIRGYLTAMPSISSDE
jgi:transcriptional regulator with XRE-family HTH domain